MLNSIQFEFGLFIAINRIANKETFMLVKLLKPAFFVFAMLLSVISNNLSTKIDGSTFDQASETSTGNIGSPKGSNSKR